MNRQILIFLTLVTCVVLVKSRSSRFGAKKREWPIKLCTADEDCEGGCCKGLFCFRYLTEDERCLFGHHLKVGCGCEAGLSCERKKFSYSCQKPEDEDESEDNFNRELEEILMRAETRRAVADEGENADNASIDNETKRNVSQF
ncbi:uncharacterized protein [Clytia hemisphaerica]|uniref:Uncharacterized protein n=1 Tax=Clytia hemisphaerica TaxID=252671 RepID=A0A7M5XDK0_9CNID|eukprot:TCONS_00002660-protein